MAPLQPETRGYNWCFTLNNYGQADIDRLLALGDKVKYLVAGKEVGESGTPHLQGYFSSKARLRFRQAKALIGGNPHIEVSRTPAASITYCKKDGDFFEVGEHGGSGKRTDIDKFKDDVRAGMYSIKEIREKHSIVYAKYQRFCLDYVLDHSPDPEIADHALRDWQQQLNATLNGPADDRTINFVVDLNGNSGKSWFCRYYKKHHDNVQIIIPGKKADMGYILDTEARVVFVDAPRSKQGDYVQYDFLEEMKNGLVFSPKYESHLKYMRTKVHVVVMMNEHPDMTKLSNDRYNIIVA